MTGKGAEAQRQWSRRSYLVRTGKAEQVQIWLNEQDTADAIALLIKLMRKNGGNETLERFLELRE